MPLMGLDSEMLINLSVGELEALAEGLLVLARHIRLDELLTKNGEGVLSGDDQCELGRLLELVDQLTILKTRARYTLRHLGMGTAREE